MSDSDDSDILADIKALDEALALDKATANDKPAVHSQIDTDSSSTDVSFSDSDDDYINSNKNVESQNAHEINKRLIRGLTLAKKKLTTLLRECEKKIERLDEKIKICADESIERRALLTTAGIPYFKDKDCYSAPKNYDTKIKEIRGELFILNITTRKPCRWTGKDRVTLLKAIQNEAIESVLKKSLDEEIEPSKEAELTSNGKAKQTVAVIPRNFNEMVGEVGEREFDWYKIAATDFDNKHSPSECRSMWNIYLHPNFRKSEWTSMEDRRLLKYAEEYQFQNWDAITEKLGTKRSAYQCFIRYNSIKQTPFTGRSWSKQEDKQLVRVLNRLKIGNHIPWAEIATYLQCRTKQQVYTRWIYRKAPHLKKGRFTVAEKDTLMKGIKMYGTNFRKISKTMMPHRTAVQLHGHYQTIMINTTNNKWTAEDDEKLIYLYKRYSNAWSKIATYFCFKSRTQVRHRHKALLKFMNRGLTIEDVHRKEYNPTNIKNKTAIVKISNKSNKSKCNRNMPQSVLPQNSDILPRLFDNLCFPPLLKSTDSQEVYDSIQLAYNTKQLYDILNSLDANLNIPDDFFNYMHLSKKEKQLLISLKQYISRRDNSLPNEIVEEFRLRMFGAIPQIDESSRFIPPPPFDGYIKPKNIKKTESINCNLNLSEKFLLKIPTEIVTCCDISSLISSEEEFQFYKLSQLLISDNYNCDKGDLNLHRLLKRKFVSNTQSLSNSKAKLGKCQNEIEELNELSEFNFAENVDENTNEADTFSGMIVPSHATLLGLKNLLLWKLLYEYQYKPTLQSSTRLIKAESPEYRKAYQTLRTRLQRLFELPIGLSSTMLQIRGPEEIFSEAQDGHRNALTKRKSKNINSTKQNKKIKLDTPADNPQQDTNAKTTVSLLKRLLQKL